MIPQFTAIPKQGVRGREGGGGGEGLGESIARQALRWKRYLMETWNFLVNHIGAAAGKIDRITLNAFQGSCFTTHKGRIRRRRSVCILRTNLTPSACSNNVQSFKICLKRGIEDTWRRCREIYVRPSREGPSKRKKMTYGKTIAIYGAISSGKNILMGKWHLTQNQRTESHRKGNSL